MGGRSTIFRFKQFSIDHAGASMKVGTDGVLLGAWVDVTNAKSLLDIGTGSGLIALMLAQRTSADALIDAVEIEPGDALQAERNVASSPWADRIHIHASAIQDFNPMKQYDCIVSNPPFFINSYQPPDAGRTRVRHTNSLSYDDLITAAQRLMTTNGSFSVILPATEGKLFIEAAQASLLFCSRCLNFIPKNGKPVERILLEFKRVNQETTLDTLVHYNDNATWTEDYKALTKAFYLKL